MPLVRLAILECDTPIDPVVSKCGRYGDIFEALLKRGLEQMNAETGQLAIQFSKWDVVKAQQYPEEAEYDALLLSGGKHSAFEDERWIEKLVTFVQEAIKIKIPIVGICFGHQIIARAMGARVGRNPRGWELAVDTVNLSTTGRELFGKDTLAIMQMHRDICFDLPPGLISIGSSPRCSLQGFFLPGRIISVQGHPEFNDFIVSQIITARHQQGIFDDELRDDGLKRAALPHDGPFIGAVICRFLLESTMTG